jgi:thioredoxin 1
MIVSVNNVHEFTSNNKVCILDFWAQWCQPCKEMMPMINEAMKSYTIGKVNVDLDPSIADLYHIMSVPTLILFIDGQPVAQKSGKMDRLDLDKFVRDSVESKKAGN